MAASRLEDIALLPAISGLSILMPGQALFGILEDLQPAEDGLILARISGIPCLVDKELRMTLESLRGKFVSIVHLAGEWSAKEGFSKGVSP